MTTSSFSQFSPLENTVFLQNLKIQRKLFQSLVFSRQFFTNFSFTNLKYYTNGQAHAYFTTDILCKELFTFLHSFFFVKFSMISPLNHGEIHNRNDHNFFQIFLFLNKKNYKKKNLFVLCGQRIPLMATITIKLQEERKILFNIYFEFRICSFHSVLFWKGRLYNTGWMPWSDGMEMTCDCEPRH